MDDEVKEKKDIQETESILNSIKKLLGISATCTDFDTDIILHINTVFMILNQLGVGPEKGFSIKDNQQVWSEFLINGETDLESIKTYVHLRVKLLFDPPLNSAIIDAIKESIRELEWRINVQVENKVEEEEQ